MRLSEALNRAAEGLAAAGNPSPRADAELLLAHTLGVARSRLALVAEIDATAAFEFGELIQRRGTGVPLQHLTGTAPFRHLELVVGPGVFIPRPETELIIDLAADQLRTAKLVVDLCAGSGAIALSVAKEFRVERVVAVERSRAAADWLDRNATARAAAGDREIEIRAGARNGDVTDPGLLAELNGQVDVVLSNPPYVPTKHRSSIAIEVIHDPDEAVFAGTDGLALMPALLAAAARLLRPGGLVVIEHDETQAETLPVLLAAGDEWAGVAVHRDLTRRPRFVSAFRTSAPAV